METRDIAGYGTLHTQLLPGRRYQGVDLNTFCHQLQYIKFPVKKKSSTVSQRRLLFLQRN
jgi:hypothetical protein